MSARIDLMIVGAQKAATTSLKNYLAQHPALATHELTEFAYFVNDDEYEEGFEKAQKKYFSGADSSGKRIIAKNAGIYTNEKALSRLKDHHAECILVLVLRNPVDRAYSSYNMEIESGWYKKKWEDIVLSLEKFKNSEKDQMFRLFIEMGMYSEHLKKIYRLFPKEQVEIVMFDELKANPAEVCSRIFKRLKADPSFVPDTSSIFNPTKRVRSKKMGKFLVWMMDNDNPLKKVAKGILPASVFTGIRTWLFNANTATAIAKPAPMPDGVRKELIIFFKSYNEELSRMTGLTTSNWND